MATRSPTNDGEPRLYGVPGAEVMYFTPEAAYEAEIEPWREEPEPGEQVEIEEWSSHPPGYHLPSGEVLVDWISDWVADYGELSAEFDPVREAVDGEVREAAQKVVDLLAAKITWRQANEQIRSLWVTWGKGGEPLLDGRPMYQSVEESEGPGR